MFAVPATPAIRRLRSTHAADPLQAFVVQETGRSHSFPAAACKESTVMLSGTSSVTLRRL
jgi:hypothetical protein